MQRELSFFSLIRRVRPGIRGKIFLAILAVCALTALGMGFAMRASFNTGFLEYLIEIEESRIASLVIELQEEHSRYGSWEPLREPRYWRRLIGRFVRNNSEEEGELPPDVAGAPPVSEPAPPRNLTAAERARRNWETAHLRSSLALFEADRSTRIAGAPPGRGAIWQPIFSESAIIGWLTREPLTGITEAIDLRFHSRQRNGIIGIALLMLVLASIASLLAASRLVVPLRRFAETTRKLASGDFSARVSPAPDYAAVCGLTSGSAGEAPKAHYDELDVFAAQLNHLALVLEQNERNRKNFLAEVAHDLRTPLAVMQGEVEALQDGLRPVSADTLGSLRAEVITLTRLVGDIHALSLADLGRLECRNERFDISALLASVSAAYKGRAEDAGLSFSLSLPQEPVPVCADEARMAQAVQNLFENSLRYTDNGGRIALVCRAEGASVCIMVDDTPPGVPDAELPFIFERFHTGDSSRSKARHGSGLGLAIARTLVEAQHGTMSAAHSPLGGLQLSICLPLAACDKERFHDSP